jgi:hypothetical protein
MTLPTLTWRQSSTANITMAGAFATVPEILAAINSALIADTGNNWMVSDYSAVNGTLEIKRAGSPSGDLATVRFMLFGGSTPNSGAVQGETLGTTRIYGTLSPDANTAGPVASYTTGNPYSGKTSTLGLQAFTIGIGVAAPGSYLYFVDSSEGLCIVIQNGTSTWTGWFGKLLDTGAAEGKWVMCLGSAQWASDNGPTYANDSDFTPGLADTPSNNRGICVEVGQPLKWWGRLYASISTVADGLSYSSGGVLHSIIIGSRNLGSSGSWGYVGILRQLRWGPRAVDRNQISSGVTLVAYFVGKQRFSATHGIYFDQVA